MTRLGIVTLTLNKTKNKSENQSQSENNENEQRKITPPSRKISEKISSKKEIFEEKTQLVNQDINNNDKQSQPSSPIINKISPTKRAFELNVKKFAQFKINNLEKDHNYINNHKNMSPLKPLELNLNFTKIRKKKQYSKQHTKSLTNIMDSEKVINKDPIEEQMLITRQKLIKEDEEDEGKMTQNQPIILPRSRRIHASTTIVSALA